MLKVVLDKRQYALKISANSIYGSYGTKNSPYLQFLPGAKCSTFLGRVFIKRAAELIEKRYDMNVIYGDTDSCIFNSNSLDNEESVSKKSIQISEEISKKFPSCMRHFI